MNIKKHAINFTSGTLSAVALIGAVAFTTPAEANDEVKNVITAVAVSWLVTEVFYKDEPGLKQNQPVWGRDENPLNERHRPGYAAGATNPMRVCGTKVIRHSNYAEQVKVNCYGQVISTRIIRR